MRFCEKIEEEENTKYKSKMRKIECKNKEKNEMKDKRCRYKFINKRMKSKYDDSVNHNQRYQFISYQNMLERYKPRIYSQVIEIKYEENHQSEQLSNGVCKSQKSSHHTSQKLLFSQYKQHKNNSNQDNSSILQQNANIDQTNLKEEETNNSNSSSQYKNKNNEKYTHDEIKCFLEKSKQNTYKNIITSFSRHIQLLKDEKTQQIYEDLTIDNWKYSYIALRVYQNLNHCGRFSLKLKNLLLSPNLQKVFVYFLQNADQFWINDSKIKDKDELLSAIKMILQAYQEDLNLLLDNICFYRKQKKIKNN